MNFKSLLAKIDAINSDSKKKTSTLSESVTAQGVAEVKTTRSLRPDQLPSPVTVTKFDTAGNVASQQQQTSNIMYVYEVPRSKAAYAKAAELGLKRTKLNKEWYSMNTPNDQATAEFGEPLVRSARSGIISKPKYVRTGSKLANQNPELFGNQPYKEFLESTEGEGVAEGTELTPGDHALVNHPDKRHIFHGKRVKVGNKNSDGTYHVSTHWNEVGANLPADTLSKVQKQLNLKFPKQGMAEGEVIKGPWSGSTTAAESGLLRKVTDTLDRTLGQLVDNISVSQDPSDHTIFHVTGKRKGNGESIDVAYHWDPAQKKLKLSKSAAISESTKETKTGRVHKAEPGGYGRKDDEDDKGKKAKKSDSAPKRGRGRPKKDADSDTGEVKKWDTDELSRWIVGSKPKTLPGKASVKHKLKDESKQGVAEGAGNIYQVKHVKPNNPNTYMFTDITAPDMKTAKQIANKKFKEVASVRRLIKDHENVGEAVAEGQIDEIKLRNIIPGLGKQIAKSRSQSQRDQARLSGMDARADGHPEPRFAGDYPDDTPYDDVRRERDRHHQRADRYDRIAQGKSPFAKEGVAESTKETKTGRVHKAEPGGYGRKDDEDDTGKKAKKSADSPKRGRGRPKKDSDSSTGEDKKWDFSAFLKPVKLKDPKGEKMGRTTMTKMSDADKAERKAEREAEKAEKKNLKDWIEHLERKVISESAMQSSTVTQVKPVSALTANGETVATGDASSINQLKAAVASGKVSIAGDEVNEREMTDAEKGSEERLKTKYDPSGMKAAMIDKYGPEKGKRIYFATIRKQAMSESQRVDEGWTLEAIERRFPHEAKMCSDGWGLDESLYEALADHYHKQGEIPHSMWHGDSEKLRDYVLDCYLKDKDQLPLLGEESVDEGLAGGLAAAVPAAVLTRSPSATMTAYNVGSGIQDALSDSADMDTESDVMLDEADFPFPDEVSEEATDNFMEEHMYENKKSIKKDIQMEAWEKDLASLLKEGMTVTTSSGQQGMGDSVSVSATDEDAQTLMKVLANAGIGVGAGFGGSFSANQSTDGQAISVEPAAHDEVMTQLTPSGDDMGNMSFLRDMIVSREDDHEHGDGEAECEDCGHSQCDCEDETVDEGNKFTGELEKHRADGVQPGETMKVDGKEYPVKSGKKLAEEPGEEEEDDVEDSGEDYEPEEFGEPEEDDEESDEDSDEDSDEEKVDESKEQCNECGMHESKCSCDHETLNEWANSPEGDSKDEDFITEIDFMTKIISGGLNGPKRDQTTAPIVPAVSYDDDVAAIRRLSGVK